MRRMDVVILIAAVTAAYLALLGSWMRYSHARAECESRQVALDDTAGQAAELIGLRSQQQQITLSARPAQDVIAQVNAVLAEVGIPSNRLRSLTPESDSVLRVSGASSDSSRYRQQSLRVMLADLSVRDVGSFLGTWRSAQPIWTPTRLELTHARGSDEREVYDLTLILSCIYLDTEGAS